MMRTHATTGVLALLLAGALSGCNPGPHEQPEAAALRERAIASMRDVLDNGESWPKVHAAEMLLALDYPQGVCAEFEGELAGKGTQPQYRIGIWRVFAQAAHDLKKRERWTGQIVRAFLDVSGPDRGHAAETLSKLGYVLDAEGRQAAREATQSPDALFSTLAHWLLAVSGEPASLSELVQRVLSPSADARRLASYALRFQQSLTAGDLEVLRSAAAAEPPGSPPRVYMFSAIFVHTDSAAERRQLREQLVAYAREGKEFEKHEAAAAFARAGTQDDLPVLTAMLDDAAPDARVGAANAILKIARRSTSWVTSWDWLVIAAYMLGMLAVGFHYARKTKTSEGYLLGDRRMRSWAVGLSLFATIFSSITFLSVPGEVIRNGPMILTQFIAFPFVFWTLGWFVIPYIMRLRVTSAYEILESRFDLSVRMLGSTLFLVAKLVWMAVIIYATADKVLTPLLGVDPRLTPWICAVLGVVTIIYTSIGGLRAVVTTDVIQTFILAGGAVVCLLLMTVSLGGVGGWFPTAWAESWEAPRFGFQMDARIAMGWMVAGTFLWHFCTSASDQTAIQRYLATRDVKAARNVILISLLTTAGIISFLGLIGFALMAYYARNPHMLGDGQSIQGSPDQLLPRYIAFALPPGATGLVIAGLLAAAMSSLSAGLNAASSVVTVDFLGRFSAKERSDRGRLRLAKLVSVCLGAAVVAISLYVSVVPGNLLEVAFRIVNLFTVPLFILFGMAIFVPWSTSFGTWVGTLASTAVAISIAFWEVFTKQPGPSFLLIMPAAFVSGMGLGMIASLLPIGTRRKLSPAEAVLH